MIRLLEKSGAASAAIGRRRGRRRRIVNSWWQFLVMISWWRSPGNDLLVTISQPLVFCSTGLLTLISQTLVFVSYSPTWIADDNTNTNLRANLSIQASDYPGYQVIPPTHLQATYCPPSVVNKLGGNRGLTWVPPRYSISTCAIRYDWREKFMKVLPQKFGSAALWFTRFRHVIPYKHQFLLYYLTLLSLD